MTDVYTFGKTVRITGTFRALGVTLTDPTTVTLVIETPGKVETTYTYSGGGVTRDSVGVFRRDVDANESGTWSWRWIGTGAVADVDEGQFVILESLLAG